MLCWFSSHFINIELLNIEQPKLHEYQHRRRPQRQGNCEWLDNSMKTVMFPSGEMVLDLNGEWNVFLDHQITGQ